MWVMMALPGCHCSLRGRRASWIRGVRGDESEEELRGRPKVESLPVLTRAALGSRDFGDVLRRVQLLNSTRFTSCPLEGAPCHNLTRRASGRKTVVGIFVRLDRSRGQYLVPGQPAVWRPRSFQLFLSTWNSTPANPSRSLPAAPVPTAAPRFPGRSASSGAQERLRTRRVLCPRRQISWGF